MVSKTQHTLYLCYFGLREPLVQTQVLPYLREIKKLSDMRVTLLTFEPNFRQKWSTEQIKEQNQMLAAEGINWKCLPYHKSPSVPATIYDILNGTRITRKLIKNENVTLLHARVHVPGLIGAIAKKITGNKIKLIFDIRGFFPEEYVDAGNWKANSLLYRSVKRIEKWLFSASDGFVILTEKAREILFPESVKTGYDRFNRPVEVIPCCVDLKKFEVANSASREEIRIKYNLENRTVITYTGSLGTWYMASEMADFLQTARERDSSTFALILTQSNPAIMFEKLKARGFTEKDFLVKKVSHSEIPKYLSATDTAISFISPCYSKLSSSPTKIAEYLASGVPVISNRGIGDVAEQIEINKVGVIIDELNSNTYLYALEKIEMLRRESDLSLLCRTAAKKEFDLEKVGGKRYRKLYDKLLKDHQ